jgi:hypothetical protein
MPHARRKKNRLVQKMSPRMVKQAAYGETRTAIIKKKLMQNKISDEAAAPANAGQLLSVKEAVKFIIISFQGREQVVAFPFEVQHAAMLDSIRRQHQNVTPISAGFFLGYTANLWVGGESMTLDLKSRPQDAELIRAFLTSPQPQFNFINGGAK